MSIKFISHDELKSTVSELTNRKARKKKRLQQYSSVDIDIHKMILGMLGRGYHWGRNRKDVHKVSSGNIDELLGSVMATDIDSVIHNAKSFSESDDLLSDCLRIKTKTTCLGFNLTPSKDRGSQLSEDFSDEAAEIKSRIDEISVHWDLYGVVKKLALDYFTYDNAILFWQTGNNEKLSQGKKESLPGIVSIKALEVNECRYYNDQGQDDLQWKLPGDIVESILAIAQQKDKKAYFDYLTIDLGIRESWILAVLSQNWDGYVSLSREEGDNWIVRNNCGSQDGFAHPSMYSIFPYLIMRQLLKDGDISISVMMKHFIQHVKLGESDPSSGSMVGTKVYWARPKEIKKMHNVMARAVKASRLVTDHTVKIDYVFPPEQMFSGAKYKKPEERIRSWSSVPEVLMSGGGTTNSSGFIGLKNLQASVVDCRDVIGQMFRIMFSSDSLSGSVGLTEGSYIKANFDTNVLKDSTTTIKELTLLSGQNAIGPTTLARETGRDPDMLRIERMLDIKLNKDSSVYEPISEMDKGKPGVKPGQHQEPRFNSGRERGEVELDGEQSSRTQETIK